MGKRDANDIVQAAAPVSNADHFRGDGRLLIGKRRRRYNAHPARTNTNTDAHPNAYTHANAYTHPYTNADADADPHANTHANSLPHRQL